MRGFFSGSKFVVLLSAGLMMAVVPFLTSCTLDTKSDLVGKRVELKQDARSMSLSTAEIDDSVLMTISKHYERFGAGGVDIVVTYDPKSKTNTAMHAAEQTARIAGTLTRLDVRPVKTDIMPLKGQGSVSKTVINYRTVTAQGPEGCEFMGGIDDRSTGADKEYGYGCSIEMLVAKQIYRPKDLAGRDDRPDAFGRRQSLVTEPYMAGVPNEPFDGESASEE